MVASQSVRYGGKASVPNIGTRTGYTFKGWFTSSDGGNTFSDTAFDFDTVITGNVSLYAKWEEKTVSYTVKHLWQNIENDNYTQHESETLSGKFGEQTEATAKTYTGFTVQTFSQQAITENSMVEIRYKRNAYTINFDSKGGSAVASQSVRYGGKAEVPSEPTKSPYDLVGWYTSTDGGETLSDTVFDFDTAITVDITLYAKWYLDLSNCTAENVVAKIEAMTESGTVVVSDFISYGSEIFINLKEAINKKTFGVGIDLKGLTCNTKTNLTKNFTTVQDKLGTI